jgi:hypothetical protein
MRTIIAGSRDNVEYSDIIRATRHCGWNPTVVLCGCARGADTFGEEWAIRNGIPVEHYPADWKKFRNGAGFIRNCEMALRADALIAIWDGKSQGTKHMINEAKKRNLKVYIYNITIPNLGEFYE